MGIMFLVGYILIVGLGTFLMKFVDKDLTYYQINFLIAIGMLAITVPLLWFSQKNFHIPIKPLPLGILIGLCMALGSILFVASLSKLAVGPASAIATGYVLFALVLSVIFLKESLDWIKLAGIALTLAGVVILSLKSA